MKWQCKSWTMGNHCSKFQWNKINHFGVGAAVKWRLTLLELRLEKCKVILFYLLTETNLALILKALISVWKLTKIKLEGCKAVCQNFASSKTLKSGRCAFKSLWVYSYRISIYTLYSIIIIWQKGRSSSQKCEQLKNYIPKTVVPYIYSCF